MASRRNPATPEDLRGTLRGVRVYITHCKSDLRHQYDRPMHDVIADQVRSLVDEHGLGAEIFPAYQGMHICKCMFEFYRDDILSSFLSLLMTGSKKKALISRDLFIPVYRCSHSY